MCRWCYHHSGKFGKKERKKQDKKIIYNIKQKDSTAEIIAVACAVAILTSGINPISLHFSGPGSVGEGGRMGHTEGRMASEKRAIPKTQPRNPPWKYGDE